ncbi:MAG TPA: hypothetical protein VFB79_02925, partial [Candidatus Angelobacter sp.]|nr:hypothetical protein [Candidatus Angelobacter sp.]
MQFTLHFAQMFRLRQYASIVLLLACFSAAGQKQQQSFYLKPDQTVDLAGDTKFFTAKQPCENWALAAGVETMLHQQDVDFDQNFWVMRLNGGELCVDTLPTMEALAKVMNQEFVLDDGRHVRLET